MNREEALKAIRERVKNENLVKHMLATEAIMRTVAHRLGENEKEWGLAGLLHDIDVEMTLGNMNLHSKVGADLARQLGASEVVVHAILTHNELHDIPRETQMDKALYCVDPLTGLITAAALVRPTKDLAGLEAKSVKKRFKERSFASGANREQIASCTEIGLELDKFIELGLDAMKEIARRLGL